MAWSRRVEVEEPVDRWRQSGIGWRGEGLINHSQTPTTTTKPVDKELYEVSVQLFEIVSVLFHFISFK